MHFLTHFQIPIWYETNTKLLTSLQKSTSTHIYDHIHEWRRQQQLIKDTILDQLLVYWFTKSLLSPVGRDVSMGGIVTKEQDIRCSQYLDLVYSQSCTLYHIIPRGPRPLNDLSKPTPGAHVNGVVSYVKS
jgi:hypothetical protein